MREGDLDDELRSHIEMETARLMEERGLTREAAEIEARRAFGSPALVAEVTRQMHGFHWLRTFFQDLRYGARTLRQSPGFTIAAVFSLALGIGASTAVFSIADTVFLRPLPYPQPERLMWVGIHFPHIRTEFVDSPDYLMWRRDNTVFEGLAATGAIGGMVMHSPEPAEVIFARVSFNFLRTLGVTPAMGREFELQEEFPNGPKAVILTDRCWRTRFHADPGVLSRVITMDGQPFTVVGVLPPSFVFPTDSKIDVLTTVPLSPTASHRDRNMSTWSVYGRLKPGVTLAQARANVETLFQAAKADGTPLFRAGDIAVVRPLQEHRVGNARLVLGLLIGAVACLLLIACANVANLLLARWAARSRELAVRAAIGASRPRLVRQLFTETVMLAALGWLGGIALVAVTLRGVVRYAAGELPRLAEVTVDARVFCISGLVALTTVLAFGAFPALRAGRVDINVVLQGAGRGVAGGHRLLRRSLVAAEVALSVILLSGAALLAQTLWHLENDGMGFQPEHLLSFYVPLRGTKIEQSRDAAADEIVAFLRRLPGTRAAARTQCTPLTGGPMSITFSRSDRPAPAPFQRGDSISACGVGTGYFEAADSRLVRGRFFTEDDFRYPDTLAIINEAAARAYFPGEDAVGKQVMARRSGGVVIGPWHTVIGVVGDSKNGGLRQPASPQVFFNIPTIRDNAELMFLVRSIGYAGALEPEIRAKLRSMDPGMFAKFETLDQTIRTFSAGPRFNSVLLGSFAAIAFLTAMIGVYGVLAFAVAQRTQEIGIRMALGAGPRGVLGLIAREGAMLVAGGTVVGLAGAMALTRYWSTLLYGVRPYDAATYVVVLAALGVAAALATWAPARRAASVDPVQALRGE
jgi:predicted permease